MISEKCTFKANNFTHTSSTPPLTDPIPDGTDSDDDDDKADSG